MPAMTDCEMLRRAVLLNPADDLARLALADAMEEAGELEYGEFIRLQVSLAAHEHGMDDAGFAPWPGYMIYSKRMKATQRAAVLLTHFADSFRPQVNYSWSVDEHHFPSDGCPGSIVTRGFVSSVRCSLHAWESNGEMMVSRHPVEYLEISNREAVLIEQQPGAEGRPYRSLIGSHCWWRDWEEHDGADFLEYPQILPIEIWEALQGETANAPRWKGYRTAELAHHALSLAMLNMARSKASLPPLSWNPSQNCRGA